MSRTKLAFYFQLTCALFSHAKFYLQTKFFEHWNNILRKNYYANSAKFILVPSEEKLVGKASVVEFFRLLKRLGISNAIIAVSNGSVWNFDFQSNYKRIDDENERFDPFYKKSFKNFEYRVIVGFQVPKVFKYPDSELYRSVDLEILKIIAEKDNSTITQIVLDTRKEIFYDVFDLFVNHTADLTVLTQIMFKFEYFVKYINTYDEDAFCALVQVPERLTFLHFLLEPIDAWCWTAIILSTTACAIFWQIVSKNVNSTLNFIFFVFGIFLGQGIPLRIDRRVLTVISQVCVLMAFVIGSTYQSLIISLMSASRNGIQFQTFDELFSSDLTFRADYIFMIGINGTVASSVMDRIKSLNFASIGNNIIDKKIAVIKRCSVLHNRHGESQSLETENNFYILPDKLMPFMEKFYLKFGSPLQDHLQRHFDFAFEAGIRQYWKNKFKSKDVLRIHRDALYIAEEKYLLTISDIYGVFYILLSGYGMALFSLALEKTWFRKRQLKIRTFSSKRLNKFC